MKYCIGDIHANSEALMQLLAHLALQSGDELIFLGDYTDKNTATEETVKLLLKLQNEYKCIFIKGNHDFVWEQYLVHGDTTRQEFILNYGGLEALSEYDSDAKKLIMENNIEKIKIYFDSYLKLMNLMKNYYVVGDYIALHAGLRESQLVEEPIVWEEFNYFIRPRDMNIEKRYLNRYTLIAGHTYIADEPTQGVGYINIDLGAGYGKYLGAFCIDTQTVIRSDGKKFNLA